MLALIYVPSAGEAWNSLQYLNHGVTLGWFLRGVHGWGSNFMVAIVLIHMVQVAMFGAYKFPRELTWIIGVFLLLMTLGMAFTGQVLRFDQDAYWGLGIGAAICGRVPFVGAWVVHLLLGGPIIAGDTLSRFFAIHVFVIPGLLIGLVSLHLLMVLKLGINVCAGISRDDEEGRRALCAGSGMEGHVLLGLHHRLRDGLRSVLRSLRPERTAGSHDCPDRA
jgi:ubiquinol-cytochrome c reductase cytochrome b subunit